MLPRINSLPVTFVPSAIFTLSVAPNPPLPILVVPELTVKVLKELPIVQFDAVVSVPTDNVSVEGV